MFSAKFTNEGALFDTGMGPGTLALTCFLSYFRLFIDALLSVFCKILWKCGVPKHMGPVRPNSLNTPKTVKVIVDLYSALSSIKRSDTARVNDGSLSFTCHPHVYPQVE